VPGADAARRAALLVERVAALAARTRGEDIGAIQFLTKAAWDAHRVGHGVRISAHRSSCDTVGSNRTPDRNSIPLRFLAVFSPKMGDDSSLLRVVIVTRLVVLQTGFDSGRTSSSRLHGQRSSLPHALGAQRPRSCRFFIWNSSSERMPSSRSSASRRTCSIASGCDGMGDAIEWG
jgi:hypothetical protein